MDELAGVVLRQHNARPGAGDDPDPVSNFALHPNAYVYAKTNTNLDAESDVHTYSRINSHTDPRPNSNSPGKRN